MDSEVIVIGAGLSGLSAAKILTAEGIRVLVLEARDRVGGRTFTKIDPKVEYVDLGGAYVGPTQNRVFRMAKEFGIKNYKVNEVEDIILYKNGVRERFQACDEVSHRNPFVNMDTNNILWLIDKMGEEIPAEAPWKAPNASEWDTMTFKEFVLKNCWTKGAVEYFKNYINGLTATDFYEASLLSFLWYVKQCGGTKRIFSTTNGAQERKIIGGSQQISLKIAEELGEAVVKKNSAVIAINQDSSDVVLVKTLLGEEYKTRYVILAMAPTLQMKIHFSPPLPPLRNQLMQRMPMGTVMKAVFYYPKTFWRENGLCGSTLIHGGEEHPMYMTYDDTKPDGSHPSLVGFILTDKCRRFCSTGVNERKEILVRSLAEVTGCSEALNPIHYEEKNWMEEQYSGGCYTTVYPPGFLTQYGHVLRTPVDRLYFAGTETAVEWSGYMEGAIESGERAAREVLHKMDRLECHQIWQSEPESKEVIALPFETRFSERYMPTVSGFLKSVAASTIIMTIAIVLGYKQTRRL